MGVRGRSARRSRGGEVTAPGPGSRQPAARLAGAAYLRAPGHHPDFETSKMASKLWLFSWDGELELPDQSGHGPAPHRPSPGSPAAGHRSRPGNNRTPRIQHRHRPGRRRVRRQAQRWPPQPLSGPGALPAAGSVGPETGHRRSPGRLDQRGRGGKLDQRGRSGKLTAGESAGQRGHLPLAGGRATRWRNRMLSAGISRARYQGAAMGMSSRVDAYQRRHRWAGHWSRSRAGRRHRGRPPSPSRA